MGSLDDFFNKKDKSKKGKGFVTFKEEVDKKQKEIERQKRFMDDEASDTEEETITKPDKSTQTRANYPKDEWNEVLEPSVLNDVLPDDEELDDDVPEDGITPNGILYNGSIESESNAALNIECPIPVGIIIGEITDLKIAATEKSEQEEQIEKEVSSEVPDVVVVGESKRITRFGAVSNKKTQDVKIDSQEDFPVLSLAVVAEKKKSKVTSKSSPPVVSSNFVTKPSTAASSSSRFFSSASKSSEATVPTSAKPLVEPQTEDLKKPRFLPSVKPAEPRNSVQVSNVAPGKPRFVSANTTTSTGGSKFFSVSKPPVDNAAVPTGVTSTNTSSEKSTFFHRKATETPVNSVSNNHSAPATPNIAPTVSKPAGAPRFFRAKS